MAIAFASPACASAFPWRVASGHCCWPRRSPSASTNPANNSSTSVRSVPSPPSARSLSAAGGRENSRASRTPPARLSWRDWQLVLQNRPLLYLAGLYGLSWLALQITPALLPYFVIHCLDLDSAAIARVVVIVQGSALLALFLWEQLSRKLGRKLTYWLGTSLWILADFSLLALDAERAVWVYALAALAGAGMATTYLIPPSMLPEVADWDELHTGQRREGLFYSLLLFLQKLALAVGLF
ncbi:MAG: MFS transporter, partial [Spirulinaceae cyanobacterium RM2_2_10]|nr:MFS transporter [Spirulinaceae cyanobacterium RM2_2_10]